MLDADLAELYGVSTKRLNEDESFVFGGGEESGIRDG